MKKMLVLSSIIFTFSIQIFGQGNMVLIDSQSSEWINTNINISVGDTIFIEASGFIAGIKSGQDINLHAYFEPYGISTYLPTGNLIDDSSPFFSLIGKIGTNGHPFFIGKRTDPIYSSEAGELYMIVNDCLDCFYDNYGYYSAVIFKGNMLTSFVNISNFNPSEYGISQNYPNPFNPATKINYSVPKVSNVQINIYDINGQLIRRLLNEYKNVGSFTETWDGKNSSGNLVSSGTYFYQIQIDNFVQTKKMILLK